MASLTVIYWRDIPAQVVAEEGRGRNRQQAKVEMPRRFALAIDEAAMRDGADSTDDYLAEWRKADPEACGDDLKAEAESRAAALDAEYDKAKLAALVANGGSASA
ncbi:MAG: virulence factor [Alphaproteobacteria bacterium]|nr:virulence factor [Alphaproteobacteria bacterium]